MLLDDLPPAGERIASGNRAASRECTLGCSIYLYPSSLPASLVKPWSEGIARPTLPGYRHPDYETGRLVKKRGPPQRPHDDSPICRGWGLARMARCSPKVRQ